jgi:murein DD-endopeptidase MepM/ murein hydrolase activator NlpD
LKKTSKWLRIVEAALATFGMWAVAAFALILTLRWLPPDTPQPPHVEEPTAERAPWLMIPDYVRRNEALADVLRRNGFSPREVHDVAEALKEHLNLRHLRRGDEVEIHYSRDGEVAVRIHRGLLETYEARRGAGGWNGRSIPIQFDRQTVVRHGVLKGSLFASMESMGETAALVETFAEVFQWDFDFHTQSRRGDRFSVMVDKVFRDGRFVGYGDLKAARYVSGDLDLAAFLYEYPPDKRGYYDREGKSMRKAFLRSPLTFTRISSGFSYSRLHPVHKRRLPHTGVDYAAPIGTPVHTVANGTVTGISRSGAGGNQVFIRHAMGYRSGYLHLSRFARGLRVGKRVAQKEVIGYVGKTGTATGPHLDFRLWRHGKPVNPLRQIYPPGPPVPEQYIAEYRQLVEVLAEGLNMPLKNRSLVAE